MRNGLICHASACCETDVTLVEVPRASPHPKSRHREVVLVRLHAGSSQAHAVTSRNSFQGNVGAACVLASLCCGPCVSSPYGRSEQVQDGTQHSMLTGAVASPRLLSPCCTRATARNHSRRLMRNGLVCHASACCETDVTLDEVPRASPHPKSRHREVVLVRLHAGSSQAHSPALCRQLQGGGQKVDRSPEYQGHCP